MIASRTPLAVAAGIALIVLPLVGLGLKLFSFGWLFVILLMGPVLVLVLGYALQIVIAAQGFLSKRALFGAGSVAGSGARRATIAAWVTTIAFVLFCIFIPDGGDNGYGSTLQVWLGAYGPNGSAVHAATDGLTEVIAYAAAAVWLLGFVWLVVEWILALARRSRAKKQLAA